MGRRWHAEQFPDWVGRATTTTNSLVITDGKRYSFEFFYTGMDEEVRKVVRELPNGTQVRFSVGRLPTAGPVSVVDYVGEDTEWKLTAKFSGAQLKKIGSTVK